MVKSKFHPTFAAKPKLGRSNLIRYFYPLRTGGEWFKAHAWKSSLRTAFLEPDFTLQQPAFTALPSTGFFGSTCFHSCSHN